MTQSHALFGSFFGRYSLVWLAVGLCLGLVLAAAFFIPNQARADEHVSGMETLVVAPTEVNFDERQGEAWVYGSGFVPGTKVVLLLEDEHGVITDMTALAFGEEDLELVANDQGAWSLRWPIGRFYRVGSEGLQTFWAVEAGTYRSIAGAPVALCDYASRADEEDPELPEFCSQ